MIVGITYANLTKLYHRNTSILKKPRVCKGRFYFFVNGNWSIFCSIFSNPPYI